MTVLAALLQDILGFRNFRRVPARLSIFITFPFKHSDAGFYDNWHIPLYFIYSILRIE